MLLGQPAITDPLLGDEHGPDVLEIALTHGDEAPKADLDDSPIEVGHQRVDRHRHLAEAVAVIVHEDADPRAGQAALQRG